MIDAQGKRLSTGQMGGARHPSDEELREMQEGNYVLHACGKVATHFCHVINGDTFHHGQTGLSGGGIRLCCNLGSPKGGVCIFRKDLA